MSKTNYVIYLPDTCKQIKIVLHRDQEKLPKQVDGS